MKSGCSADHPIAILIDVCKNIDIFLGLLLWKKLELDNIFNKLQTYGREEIEWKTMFCLSVIARLCSPSSELAIAESWYDKTALGDLLGISAEKINDDRLYRTLDHIIAHILKDYLDLIRKRNEVTAAITGLIVYKCVSVW